MGDGGNELVLGSSGFDLRGDVDQGTLEVEDLTVVVVDGPGRVLDPYGGSVRALQLNVEVVHHSVGFHLFQPAIPGTGAGIHGLYVFEGLEHRLHTVEAEEMSQGRIRREQAPVR